MEWLLAIGNRSLYYPRSLVNYSEVAWLERYDDGPVLQCLSPWDLEMVGMGKRNNYRKAPNPLSLQSRDASFTQNHSFKIWDFFFAFSSLNFDGKQ